MRYDLLVINLHFLSLLHIFIVLSILSSSRLSALPPLHEFALLVIIVYHIQYLFKKHYPLFIWWKIEVETHSLIIKNGAGVFTHFSKLCLYVLLCFRLEFVQIVFDIVIIPFKSGILKFVAFLQFSLFT